MADDSHKQGIIVDTVLMLQFFVKEFLFSILKGIWLLYPLEKDYP